jgi:hypothetical protein
MHKIPSPRESVQAHARLCASHLEDAAEAGRIVAFASVMLLEEHGRIYIMNASDHRVSHVKLALVGLLQRVQTEVLSGVLDVPVEASDDEEAPIISLRPLLDDPSETE